jgi:hypothetical protein
MIVKILGNKGGGSAGAAIDYMLGKERDRNGAILLSGDPDLTVRLADNLDFKNRYTVGVLSFEEANLNEYKKQKIMQSFEETLLAGLDRDQYDITWIEHTDKGRLELNFIIPNVELRTGKRLQPYYDKLDRPLVENWKQTTNFKYNLSDPNAPEKAQVIKVLNTQNLPKNVREIKEKIGSVIEYQISQGIVQNRNDIIDILEKSGFEIVRQTERSISIKNPNGQRNIRLEGTIYENREFDQQFTAEYERSGEVYKRTSEMRHREALEKLGSLVRRKQQENWKRFTSQFRPDSTRAFENQRYNTLELIYRRSDGDIDIDINNTNRTEFLVLQELDRQKSRASRDQTKDRSNKIAGINIGQSHNYSDSRRFVLDNGEESTGLGNQVYRFKQQKNPNRTNKIIESDNDQRLYESIQRFINIITRRNGQNRSNELGSERTDRIIEEAEQKIASTKSVIEQSKSVIEQSKSVIEQSKSVIEQSKSVIEQSKSVIEQSKSVIAQSKSVIEQHEVATKMSIRREISIEKKDRDTGFNMNM